jgi:hypothetical protein
MSHTGAAADRVGSPPGHDGMTGTTLRAGFQITLEPVERRETVSAVLVADVVGEASEPVDRQQIGADFARQKAQRNRKVLGSTLRLDRVQSWDAFGYPLAWCGEGRAHDWSHGRAP